MSGGGRLKIKGSKVQDGRVDKKKKKKKRDKEGDVAMRKEEGAEEEKADAAVGEASSAKEEKERRSRSVSELLEGDDGKTEAERRHAEAKRKRVRLPSLLISMGGLSLRLSRVCTAQRTTEARGCQDA